MSDKIPVLRITQLEMAARQLSTAAKLFFFDEDPCSIYALTRNGEEIISCLLKKKGKKSFWNGMLDFVKPEYKEKVRKSLDYPRNVLKHAIHNEDDLIDLYLGGNEHVLCAAIQEIHVSYPSLMAQYPNLLVFKTWYLLHNLDLINETIRDLVKPYLKIANYSKLDFYNTFIEIAKSKNYTLTTNPTV